jgi:hypothetical protein
MIERGLVRTSANCGIDASWMDGAVDFAGWCVVIMMQADVGIAVMMKLEWNEAGSSGLVKAIYAACSQ